MPMTLQANKKTTISGDFAAGATSLTLATSAFTNFTDGYLVLDYDNDSKFEIIKCTVTGTAVSSITRGIDGTSDVLHSSGAKIGFMFVPSHFSDITPVLGFASVTANQGSITSEVDLTSLTATVTVPTSGRRIRITGYACFQNTTATEYVLMRIKESTTTLCQGMTSFAKTATDYSCIASVIITPTAGSHTYKLSAEISSGTGTMGASSVKPAYILVEYL